MAAGLTEEVWSVRELLFCFAVRHESLHANLWCYPSLFATYYLINNFPAHPILLPATRYRSVLVRPLPCLYTRRTNP